MAKAYLLTKNHAVELMIFAIFELHLIVGLLRHKMWRDEVQVWLISVSSTNLNELLLNMKFEGKPPLYFFLVWIASGLIKSPESLKIITFIFSSVSIYVVVFKLKIIIFHKISILTSFLFFYGYTIISRDYSLTLCLNLILICVIQKKSQLYRLISLTLILTLCSVNAYSLILSFFWLSYYILNNSKNINRYIFFVYFPVVILNIFFIYPEKNNVHQLDTELTLVKDFLQVPNLLTRIFIPEAYISIGVKILVIIFIFSILVYLAYFSIKLFIPFTVSAIAFILFYNNSPSNYWWHYGSFILLIYSVLILILQSKKEFKTYASLSLALVNFSQLLFLLNGSSAFISQTQPYSNGQIVADFVADKCGQDCKVYGVPEGSMTTPSAFLLGHGITLEGSRGPIRFVVWNQSQKNSSFRDFVSDNRVKCGSIIITNGVQQPVKGIIQLRGFTGAVWQDENYFAFKKI